MKSKNYLGNNFWKIGDNRILNTKTKKIYEYESEEAMPPTMRWHKSFNMYEIYEKTNYWELEEGKRIIIFDVCERVERHKKTLYCTFEKFTTIDHTHRKIRNKWVKFEHGFLPGRAYMILAEIDHEYPDSLHILKKRELKPDFVINKN